MSHGAHSPAALHALHAASELDTWQTQAPEVSPHFDATNQDAPLVQAR